MSNLDAAIEEAFGEPVGIEPDLTPDATPEALPESGTPEATGQPRDEQGRFTKEQQEELDQAEQQLIAGKFKSYEELERAYDELQRFSGSQGQEYGELKKEFQELRAALEPQQDYQPQLQINQQTVDWFDEQVATNPQGAAMWAKQNDPSGVLYERAMESWYEENPRQAGRFETNLALQDVVGIFAQQQAPLQQQAMRNEFAAQWATVRQEIPDLDQYADGILQAAQEAPEILATLQQGTPDAQQRTIRNLYKLAKFDQLGASPAEQAQDTGAAERQQAFVASGSQHQEPEVVSEGEQWVRDNLDSYFAQYQGDSPW